MGDQDNYIEVGNPPEGTDVDAFVVTPMRDDLTDELSSWLNDKLQQRNAPVSMAAEYPIDMEDPRIREWTQEELEPVHRWLHMGRAQSFFKSILKVMKLLWTYTMRTLSDGIEHELGGFSCCRTQVIPRAGAESSD